VLTLSKVAGAGWRVRALAKCETMGQVSCTAGCTQAVCLSAVDELESAVADWERRHFGTDAAVDVSQMPPWGLNADSHSRALLISSLSEHAPMVSARHLQSLTESQEADVPSVMNRDLGNRVSADNGSIQRSDISPAHRRNLCRLTQQFGLPDACEEFDDFSPPVPEGGDDSSDRGMDQLQLFSRVSSLHRQVSDLDDVEPADAEAEMSNNLPLPAPSVRAVVMLQAKLPLKLDKLAPKRSTNCLAYASASPVSDSDGDSNIAASGRTDFEGFFGHSFQDRDTRESEVGTSPANGKSPAASDLATNTQQHVAVEQPRLPGLLFSSLRGSAGEDCAFSSVRLNDRLSTASSMSMHWQRMAAEKPSEPALQLSSLAGSAAEDDEVCTVAAEEDEVCTVLVSGKSLTANDMATHTQQSAVAKKPRLPGLLFSSVKGPAVEHDDFYPVQVDDKLPAAKTIAVHSSQASAVAEKPRSSARRFSSLSGPSVEEEEICRVPVCGSMSGASTMATSDQQSMAAEQPRLHECQLLSMEGRAAEGIKTDKSQENLVLPVSMQTPQDELDLLRKRDEESMLNLIHWEREAQQRVACFLKSHGFKGVCAKKRRLMGFLYPLHVAVKQNDVRLVLALLKLGADPWQIDSSGRTPYQLALSREDGRGSHTNVMHALTRAGAAVTPAAVLVRSASAPLMPEAAPSHAMGHPGSCVCRSRCASSKCA